MIGRQVSHFYIVGKIGGGGMGDVYEAQDTRLPRAVAVKFLKPGLSGDRVAVRRFRREARLASSLNHPGICTVLDVEEAEGQPFIAMELLDGRSLRDRLAEGAIPLDEAIEIATQVADALAAAHEQGIVHRDITPGNIFLTARGDVKLLDFGLAKTFASSDGDAEVTDGLTQAGAVAGTVHYASPEHLTAGQVDGRSDLFSLGVVLYQMVSGARPFDGRVKADVLKAVVGASPVPLGELAPSVPRELDRMVARLLAKRPDERYQRAADLLADLATLRASLADTAPIETTAPRPAPATSVAVLPFRPVGDDDPETRAFRDGVAQAIAWRLQQAPGIVVAAQTSTDSVRGKTVREIGARLSVGAVVEGSVQRVGRAARVMATVVAVATEQPLAPTVRVDVTLDDPLAAQDQAALTVADRTATTLAAVRLGPGTRNREALAEYQKSRHYLRRRFAGGWPQAIEHAERAVELDPTFALAHVNLSVAYGFLGFFSVMQPRLAFERAHRAATRALDLDPGLAAAHDALGLVRFGGEWDWEGAERSFREALRLDPGQPTTRVNYGLLLAVLGRHDGAVAEIDKALAVSRSPAVVSGAANVYEMVGRVDDAIALCNECLRADNDHVFARYVRGQCHHLNGGSAAACADLERAANLGQRTPFYLGLLGKAYAEAGRRDQATALVRELDAQVATRYVPPHVYVFIYAGLGDTRQALAYQEQAYTDGAPPTNYLNPFIRGLFSLDPHHKDRLRQMRLTV